MTDSNNLEIKFMRKDNAKFDVSKFLDFFNNYVHSKDSKNFKKMMSILFKKDKNTPILFDKYEKTETEHENFVSYKGENYVSYKGEYPFANYGDYHYAWVNSGSFFNEILKDLN